MKIIKIKNAKNALASIKAFSKEYAIVINKMLNLANKTYKFFEKKYSSFATHIFFHLKNDSFISNLNN